METIIKILGWVAFIYGCLVIIISLLCAVRYYFWEWKWSHKKVKAQMWFARWFQIISEKQAREWSLTFSRNIYGDEVNLLDGARSIWLDQDKNVYRVQELIEPNLLDENSLRKPPHWDKLIDKYYEKDRCPICHYETSGEGHRCILTTEQL